MGSNENLENLLRSGGLKAEALSAPPGPTTAQYASKRFDGPIAGKPAPTVSVYCPTSLATTRPVGAGLPAKSSALRTQRSWTINLTVTIHHAA